MNDLKTTKMNSKILVVVLLAYILDNLSAATLKPDKSTSLNGKNTPAQYKNTLVFNQPIKSHHPVFGNLKVNPTVPAPPSPPAIPPAPSKPPAPKPPANTFPQSIKKPLPPSRASAPTTVPTNENDNDQGFDTVEYDDDDYEEEEEEEGDEEHLENSKTVKIPTQSKPTITTKVNNSSNKFQTSQPKLSSSTSKPIVPESVKQENGNQQGFETLEGDDYEEEVEEEVEEIEDEDHEEPLKNSKTVTSQPKLSSSTSKPIVPESVKQENGNQQGFETLEGDDYEEEVEEEVEEIEDEDHEEPLKNSKTVTSQPKLSSSTSKPIVPESVKQENGNQQGFETLEGDDYEEEVEEEVEEIEDEDHEEPLENSKTVTSQPKLSSSTSKPIVPESVKQENDNHQGFETLGGDDYEEVSEENEYEEYSEDPDHNTNGVQANRPVPMNNPISTVPQLSEDELTENNFNESEYSLNTDEDHPSFQNDDEWEPKSSNINNNPTEISEILDRKNDNIKDQLIDTNEFESNPYDNTQISTDKQEENAEYQFKNHYVSENKERIINGYKAMKKILYMLHDFASSTFNWIINKINYRMEQFSS